MFESILIRIENKLEAAGKWSAAQQLRRKQEKDRPVRRAEWGAIHSIITIDIKLREIVQREAFLLGECQELRKKSELDSLTPKEKKQLEDREKELQNLDKQYWCQERLKYQADATLSSRPFRRGYISYQKNPMWHLFHWLRDDCAGRGGCCGHDCGCCERPRTTNPDRRKKFGHCTVECGCCRRRRGFELDSEAKELARPKFDFTGGKSDQYSRNLFRAHFWGVVILP